MRIVLRIYTIRVSITIPTVSIVGRPNVGKSSLLNRLARRRVSIVDPTPGVTRDRVSAILELDAPTESPKGVPSRLVEVTDTGGYGIYTADDGVIDDAGEDLSRLTEDIEGQIAVAMERSSLIMMVCDAQSGLLPLDHAVAEILRRKGQADRVMLVANKTDGESWEAHAMEMASLGLGEPLCVSATSGYCMRLLTEELWRRVEATDDDPVPESEMRLAIVGRRNAGKSTLINALAGEERVIVSEIAGTTRDAVDVRFEMEGHQFLAIDTAGLRRKKSFADDIEFYAYRRMLNSIRRADVVLFMVDATQPVSKVDEKLSQELQRQFKPVVLVVNKWDLADEEAEPEEFADYLTKTLRGLSYAPICLISAAEGEGLQDLVSMAFNLHAQANHREPTAQINSVVKSILSQRGPSSRLGTQAKLYYASQVAVQPPTLALVVNQPKMFEGRYERYLMNRLREELPFSEVPIRLLFSRKSRKSLQSMRDAGRSAARSRPDGVEGIDDEIWQEEGMDLSGPDQSNDMES